MIQNRITRVTISLIITIVIMVVLNLVASDSPSRIIVMLGGTWPAGIIQGVTYFLFFFGMFEVLALHQSMRDEEKAFGLHLLPEQEHWLLNTDDALKLKDDVDKVKHLQPSQLADVISKACARYRLGKSSAESLSLVEAQVGIYNAEKESAQSFIRYTSWAIPSVGFIGTVVGIAQSLGFANEANTPEGIQKVTDSLSIAFDTTLVALLLSVVLMLVIHAVQKQQDDLYTHMKNYVIENLINRFYK